MGDGATQGRLLGGAPKKKKDFRGGDAAKMSRKANQEKAKRAPLRAGSAVPALQPVPERRQFARIAAQDRAAEVQAELHEGGAVSSMDVCADVLRRCAGTDALDEPLDESAAPVLLSLSERRRFNTKAARKVVEG